MFGKKKHYKAQNSRRYKRLRAEYLVKYQVAGTQDAPVVTHLKDLSAGGVKFWTEQFIAEGALVKASILVLPLDLTVETLARVVRVRQAKNSPVYYIALNFIELSQDAKRSIDSFVESLAAQRASRDLVSGGAVIKRTILA